MWIVGLLLAYIFYRFAFAWYFNFFLFSNPLLKPVSWRSPWFHICVLCISAFLLLASAYFFFLSSHWLILSPIPIVIGSYITLGIKRGAREEKIIYKAVKTQVRMSLQGAKQAEINRAVAASTIGDQNPIAVESDFPNFLKFSILGQVGLLRNKDPEMFDAQLREVDELIAKRTEAEEHILQRKLG